jgi:Flp pilus assembly pilin Flp
MKAEGREKPLRILTFVAPAARPAGLGWHAMRRCDDGQERGAASVEQAGLVTLVALLLLTGVAAVAAGGEVDAGHTLAGALARKIACAPRLPDSCRHHPLVPAYGWPLARLARALAPAPTARPGPGGLPLVPVDFRRCRRESCAVAAGSHLTASGRRTTAFTQIEDRRRSLGWVEIVYWLYRPTIGWNRVVRRATQADVEAAAGTRVLLKDDPMLVPLETLPGRDHYDFPAREEPPWRWRVGSRYPGWSS